MMLCEPFGKILQRGKLLVASAFLLNPSNQLG
jgi:hypothetical protein